MMDAKITTNPDMLLSAAISAVLKALSSAEVLGTTTDGTGVVVGILATDVVVVVVVVEEDANPVSKATNCQLKVF